METSGHPGLGPASAIALILGSRLFDDQWYAAQSGLSFASREDAITHWVEHADAEASPHPLFEPLWLYPRGRWRKHAPDPLSYYLSRPDDRARSPHPLVDLADTGPLDTWLETHSVDEILASPVDKTPPDRVTVVVLVDGLPRAVSWMRHLHRLSPDVLGVVRAPGVGALRVLTSVAAGMPSIRTYAGADGWVTETPVSVLVDRRSTRLAGSGCAISLPSSIDPT